MLGTVGRFSVAQYLKLHYLPRRCFLPDETLNEAVDDYTISLFSSGYPHGLWLWG